MPRSPADRQPQPRLHPTSRTAPRPPPQASTLWRDAYARIRRIPQWVGALSQDPDVGAAAAEARAGVARVSPGPP